MSCLLPLMLGAALAGCSAAPERPTWRGQALDGVWVAQTIDGRDVGRKRYAITVERGRVTGGHDGCNGWGFQWQDGRRTIASTLIGCPRDPLDEGYWAVVYPEPWTARLNADGRLEALAAGHRVLFRRER